MKKTILFLLLNILSLTAQDSIKIFSDNFGDGNRVQGIGFILKSSENEYVKILLKKENLYQGYSYKGAHSSGEYSQKYLNNIYINAKDSQKLFIYSPAIKTCELEFNVVEFNHVEQEAKLSFEASLVGEKRALKTLKKQEFSIKGKNFQKLIKLLKADTFSMNYQRFTNKLRNRLSKNNIKLFRGEIQEYENHTSISFKTSTTFEITMNADKKSLVKSLSISFGSFSIQKKKSAVKIIAAAMNVLDSKKEHRGKYLHNTKELLQNSPNVFRTTNAKFSITKNNFFEVLPLFNH